MKTLRDLYTSDGFATYIGSKLGSDLFISDPDRASRIYEAASDGCDGSTHAEHIEDWREYLATFREDDEGAPGTLPVDVIDAINAEIDACEAWHEKNGTLHQEVG